MAFELYTDAGIVIGSPSVWGGSWSWILVNHGAIVSQDSGHLRPSHFGLETVENNLLETFALARGIAAMPNVFGMGGVVYCDNENAIRRQLNPRTAKMKFVPDWLKDQLTTNAQRFKLDIRLLGGHPTKAELAAGKREDGKVVSRWNVLADKMCQAKRDELARELNAYDVRIPKAKSG